mmetsp:Transcript_85899/g.152154  ORF Transcript_85899/g.152154 Transcript_85899/m.152154 type:complete len:257 (-) Transcript_85899:138-908(-)|eukprot:CAMPEP_0197653308 /NCGR_PEP_ID=MMETSP1338-20131121/34976_1 /TAXON_ID=43686 ORGANISM="Pelagodinium beii, Strain RCC1491" /NCGR_SAMPLE_ID=MMETSP1338 /ASSEMBLY_ACC=CAM_ASM_000754 /LENGTH=256 /DNA_ID=CAMNT_0043228361 /DNA_START=75 /DNA_END=845 /DNA_ORIENTATION=+
MADESTAPERTKPGEQLDFPPEGSQDGSKAASPQPQLDEANVAPTKAPSPRQQAAPQATQQVLSPQSNALASASTQTEKSWLQSRSSPPRTRTGAEPSPSRPAALDSQLVQSRLEVLAQPAHNLQELTPRRSVRKVGLTKPRISHFKAKFELKIDREALAQAQGMGTTVDLKERGEGSAQATPRSKKGKEGLPALGYVSPRVHLRVPEVNLPLRYVRGQRGKQSPRLPQAWLDNSSPKFLVERSDVGVASSLLPPL